MNLRLVHSREFLKPSARAPRTPCMRDGFRDIVGNWTEIEDLGEITRRIVALARWLKANGGEPAMEGDERATFRAMVECQIRRAVRAGAFEPFVACDVEEAAIAEIFDFEEP
jgi:hypothetical protein